jgi:hypothetical protein
LKCLATFLIPLIKYKPGSAILKSFASDFELMNYGENIAIARVSISENVVLTIIIIINMASNDYHKKAGHVLTSRYIIYG